MSITVNIGVTSSEKRALDKSVSTTKSVSGTLHNQSNIVNPSILCKCNAESIATCNYMEISDFGRKYFITDITAVSNDLCIVSGHCDVLSTYKAGIRANTATVARSATEGNWNLLLNDPMMKVNNKKITKVKTGFTAFPKNQFSIMLITAG
ncbi:MAG: hypothetical protein IIY21_21080 [Clostridiales bacterium]|nr:hypothetical protein [Clostridiales bacterium]